MSAKKQDNQIESIRNAASGYAAVVLGIVCFVLVLAVVMAGVRVITSVTTTSATTTNTVIVTGSGAT